MQLFKISDTTKPTIQLSSRQGTQPCDGTYVVRVRKYESIDLRDIAVSYSDNDRIMSFQVEPRNVNTTLKVENDMTVRYTAVDYSLNQASCEIQIRIIGMFSRLDNEEYVMKIYDNFVRSS